MLSFLEPNRWSMLYRLAIWAFSTSPATHECCKATPGSPSWPLAEEWSALNKTLDGRLLKPSPPAAMCHADQPTYDPTTCASIDWTSAATYANNPLGIINPNWSNDSCLPQPKYPCSGKGFPVYVVNATSATHVAAAVNFARKHNVRLNVKGSGHDYLGRSVAPNSLSIWTKYIRGFKVHDCFRPDGDETGLGIVAVTLGAGEDWGDIYEAIHLHDRVIVGGTGDTIGLGGYLTGGGHSPLSAKFGLAVDQVLQMEVVTASGDVRIINAIQDPDLFWAMRGGGGATFGVLTSVTLKTFPPMPFAAAEIAIITERNSEAFWNATTFVVSQSPRLQSHGVVGYCYLTPGRGFNGLYIGSLLLPNGTVSELEDALDFLKSYVSSIPGLRLSITTTGYVTFLDWYRVHKNIFPIGDNTAIGNRLLDAKALSNTTALRAAMKVATPINTIANLNLIAGPGLWHAKPAGGSDSVTPAWRSAYVEYVVPVSWPFLNNTAGALQAHLLTDKYMQALRELAPDTGSYVNEGDVHEPDFQKAFWGENYPRLLDIKRRVDPWDVFWCAVCVGSEGWRVVNGTELCRV